MQSEKKSVTKLINTYLYIHIIINQNYRYSRIMNRRKAIDKHIVGVSSDTVNEINDDSDNFVDHSESDPIDISEGEIFKTDQECQVDFTSPATIEQTRTFTCNRYIYTTNNYCDAEVQTELPKIVTLKTIVSGKIMKDQEVQCGFNEVVLERNMLKTS